MTPNCSGRSDVCELAQLQPYVLRSWEKEFPGIWVQKDARGAASYRQADVDQVLRIKQLVFGEGLTLAGARRRLEERTPKTTAAERQEVAEVSRRWPRTPDAASRTCATVCEAILQMLSRRTPSRRAGLVPELRLGTSPTAGKRRALAARQDVPDQRR